MNRKLSFLLFFSIISVCIISYALSSVDMEIGGKSLRIDSYEKFNLTYVSITELNEVLKGEVSWNQLTKKGTWQFNGHELILSPFSPYIVVDTTVYNLVREIEFKKGTIYVPLETFKPILGRLVSQEISWGKKERKLSFNPSKMNILDIRASQKTNGILIEIFLSEPLEYHLFLGDSRWVNVNFYEGKLDTAFFSGRTIPKCITEIKAYQFDNAAQLSLKMAKGFDKHLEQMQSNPYCLQVSLEDTAKTAVAIQSSLQKENLEDNRIDVVVIDPGHGGEDLGAVGPSGLVEKDVTLDIAKKLSRYLREEKGLKVMLTRREDVFVALEERSRIANRAGGDIFISIHANSAPRKTATGFETFFLAQSKNDEARAVATLENASLQFEKPKEARKEISDLDFILLDMVQNEFLKESSELASIIQQELDRKSKRENRGVDQAEFVVLNKTYMPAILVEVAFISNKEEEKLLKKDSVRDEIAKSLYQSIKRFKQKYETKGKK
ncbi:MAG TPA: N-acetylmuramoyl-L-alanine amidase [candidate division Zixibacteria bacterium]